ncbi:MAG TPA: gephyrin-like molybdotransferase Glp [Candidatus Obscuribacterales bacterium]
MLMPVNQAEAKILDLMTPLDAKRDSESVSLLAADGRILAEDVVSSLDFPHWDNSAMDGYAVRFMDTKTEGTGKPVSLTITEEIPAGYLPQKIVGAGQAARIFTGGMIPEGADTVIMQEHTQREGDRIFIMEPPKRGDFVRRQGAYYKAGQTLLRAGTRLGAADIAVLAAAQCPQVQVYRRPRVAILSTGNELVSPEQPLQPGQIVDSNQYALAALVQRTGAEAICLGIVPDDPDQLKAAIAQAVAQSDMVLSSGGVSVGDYDYVDRILADLGGTLHIRAVAVKPGKPLTVATLERDGRSHLYFGLPGNPVSALVSVWRFVQPALRKLSGITTDWRPTFVMGHPSQLLKSDGKRETYLWGSTYYLNGAYEFNLAGGSHSSGNLINLAQTNSLAIIPIGQKQIPIGGSVRIILLD